MKALKSTTWLAILTVSTLMVSGPRLCAQSNNGAGLSTPPLTLEDKQAMYNSMVEFRTSRILAALALTDAAVSNRVGAAIQAQYHALRARDEAIDDALWDLQPGSAEYVAQRNAMFPGMSQPLHTRFLALLSRDLTPAQLDLVKDKMTYGKVAFTYHAYCSILPDLSEADKSRIMDLLKQARELAMDGGSSGEKTAMFQAYKDQINQYLAARGFDVAKATAEWSSRQAATKTNGVQDNAALPAN